MTAKTSDITDALDFAGLAELAYRRTDREGGYLSEVWDITLPDEETTVRLCDDDGQIILIVFTGGRAMLVAGEAKFSGALASPTFVAAALEQIIADYS